MREMSTDRPDKTESAYTVDAEHFQFEADLVSFGIDRWNADGERVFGVNVANVNLKAGLYNNVDLQVVVENYIYEQVRADGVTARKSGFGDLTTRLKVNLWGNDGGTTAFAAPCVPTDETECCALQIHLDELQMSESITADCTTRVKIMQPEKDVSASQVSRARHSAVAPESRGWGTGALRPR
jgi:hypothetical protein